MTRYRLTRRAAVDLADILRHSARQFGPRQRDAYAALIEAAATHIALHPDTPAARPRPDLATDVRAFHVEHAVGRRGAASHILYFIASAPPPARITIIRILHESMDPSRHHLLP